MIAKQGRQTQARSASPDPPARNPRFGRFREKEVFILLGLFLLALLPRLLYVVELDRSPLGSVTTLDTETHRMLAERIAETGSSGEEVFFRAPLYPYILGWLHRIFGGGMLAPRILQVVLGALVAPLTFLLGLRLAHRRAALAAAVFTAFYWTLIYFGGELLITTLLVPLDLLLLLVLVWQGADRIPPPPRALLAGLFLGLSALARPNILVALPVALIWMAWLVMKPEDAGRESAGSMAARWRRWLAPALALILGCAVVIAPVTLRNQIVGKDRVLIASQGGINFYLGNNPGSNGRAAAAPCPWDAIPDDLRRRESDNIWSQEIIWISSIHLAEEELGRRDLRPSEVSAYWWRRAMGFIRDDPLAWLSLLGRKAYYLINAYEIPSNKDLEHFVREGRVVSLRILSLGAPGFFPFGIIGPLGILGMAITWGRRRHLLMHLFMAVYALGIVLFFVNARFRIPLLPLLLIYGAVAFGELIERWRHRRTDRRLLCLLLGLALLLGIVNSRFFDVRDSTLLATLHYNLATNYLLAGDTDRAERTFREALGLDPEFPEIYTHLGDIYFDRERYDLSADQYLRALKLRPDIPVAHLKLGLIAFIRNEDDQARRRIERSLELEPNSSFARYSLGNVLARQGLRAESIDAYRRALELDPDSWKAAFKLGNLLYAAGELEEAREAFSRSLAVKPDQAPARGNLGIVLHRLGRSEEALGELSEALRLDPDQIPARLQLARILQQKGDGRGALREVLEILRREPDNAAAMRMRSELESVPER